MNRPLFTSSWIIFVDYYRVLYIGVVEKHRWFPLCKPRELKIWLFLTDDSGWPKVPLWRRAKL
jgi:hypothetical protein